MNNCTAKFYAVIVWLTILLVCGYKAYQIMITENNIINIQFKTIQDVVNGNN